MNTDSSSKGFFGKLFSRKKPADTHDAGQPPVSPPANNLPSNTHPDVPGKKDSKATFLQRLRSSLKKTHDVLVTPVDELILGRKQIDVETYEGIEEILVLSDVGPATSARLIAAVQSRLRHGEATRPDLIKQYLKEEMLKILSGRQQSLDISAAKPFVVMAIGVNGAGKTTTIAKLAGQFRAQGRKVMLAAADTFRAAGIEQLEIWAERSGCEVIKQKKGTDPSAVVFDAIHAAKARNADLLIVDTAGRLHTKVNLMEELKKIKRIMSREYPGAPHETLLVLDATTGQNAISQAKQFKEALGYTGIVLTKLDGSAKGGVIVGICDELKIPIRAIGIGEQMDDLREFNAQEFVDALFE
ncbi:MAG TPA: signal recognition particle-docking protein FtsY [Thermodesulfobacteriota bacterium]|nr:signal recognition particle-docking protein FtsY [Thermodesulfobacteriota bacterium]HOC39154.1 signal recognition particle-docking protein FtsY [Thermodesulfobacteriota bacterium]HQO77606.1 signal recognition particle-docking protein FtsY [Thermodesulfobacteriota bacterium]